MMIKLFYWIVSLAIAIIVVLFLNLLFVNIPHFLSYESDNFVFKLSLFVFGVVILLIGLMSLMSLRKIIMRAAKNNFFISQNLRSIRFFALGMLIVCIAGTIQKLIFLRYNKVDVELSIEDINIPFILMLLFVSGISLILIRIFRTGEKLKENNDLTI